MCVGVRAYVPDFLLKIAAGGQQQLPKGAIVCLLLSVFCVCVCA